MSLFVQSHYLKKVYDHRINPSSNSSYGYSFQEFCKVSYENDEFTEFKDQRENLNRGLKNFGQICYINALLQCLFHIEPFRNSLFTYFEKVPSSPIFGIINLVIFSLLSSQTPCILPRIEARFVPSSHRLGTQQTSRGNLQIKRRSFLFFQYFSPQIDSLNSTSKVTVACYFKQ